MTAENQVKLKHAYDQHRATIERVASLMTSNDVELLAARIYDAIQIESDREWVHAMTFTGKCLASIHKAETANRGADPIKKFLFSVPFKNGETQIMNSCQNLYRWIHWAISKGLEPRVGE